MIIKQEYIKKKYTKRNIGISICKNIEIDVAITFL